MDDKPNLFGTYLETRWQPSQFLERNQTTESRSHSCGLVMDAKSSMPGMIPKMVRCAEIRLYPPATVNELLSKLLSRNDNGAR
jgi:hypothetical protein